MEINSRWRSLLALTVIAIVGACSREELQSRPRPLAQSLADTCTGIDGYARFRRNLTKSVERRDGIALRALFHSHGSMRVNGIGGRMTTPDWGLDRRGAAVVWRDLDEILGLGCARRGDKLIIPAMAALGVDGLGPGHAIALRDVALHTRPTDHAPIKRFARRGELLTVNIDEVVSGWTELLDDDGSVFVSTRAIRSPHATRLELTVEQGQWTIRDFGSGV